MTVPPHLEASSAQEILRWGIETFGRRMAIAASFQDAGMALLDMAAEISPAVRVFTLDTGRLPQATCDMIAEVRRHYGIEVEMVYPDPGEVEGMVRRHGEDLFYASVANRMLCCQIRKSRPLERKLGQLDAWATGLRRGQSATRAGVRKVEIDAEHGSILKLNPLADWSDQQVEAYLLEHGVPRHPLYAQGYTSIGCQPCTRPTAPGEPARAGRWWWETEADKECGIHFTPDGRARREVDVLLEEILGS